MSTTPLKRHARSRPRHLARRWIKRIVLALVALGGLALLIFAWLPSPVAVDVAVARRGALDVEVDEDGQTRVRDRFVVAAPTSGMLERIELQAGATVARGDVIARIAPPDPVLLDDRTRSETTARLAAAAARARSADTAITRAMVARDAAVREANRSRALAERGAISGAERDRAELEEQLAIRDVAAARTMRAAADAEVAAVRAVIENGKRATPASHPVIAPAGGRILRVLRDSAGPVLAGAPLFEVGDPSATEVVVDVLSSDATRIRPGMEAAIEGWGGEPLRAVVRLVEPSGFTRISALGVEEQRVKVILEAERPPATLGDGFRVDARIFLWRGSQVLAVPASAVFRDHDRWSVYTIEDGRARLRRVELGHRGRFATEIVGGLAEGATVILHPGDRVREAGRVAPR
jgi:HlyD family secretion protein